MNFRSNAVQYNAEKKITEASQFKYPDIWENKVYKYTNGVRSLK